MQSVSAFPRLAPTSEAAWLRWTASRPRLDVGEISRPLRLLVVSPHPDDETLACGALIADRCGRGDDVHVLAVTDGEGSHPGVAELAAVRRAEQSTALAHLGCPRPATRLAMPDGEVRTLADDLERAIRAVASGCDLLIAPWARDGHTDHDACGTAARAVADALDLPLLAYPVWAWQWATPLEFDDAAAWSVSTASARAVAAKRAALGCFPSQTTDRYGTVIVDDAAMERFRRPFEVFARVR